MLRRLMAVIALSMVIASCDQSPDQIGKTAQDQIQKRLNEALGAKSQATVSTIVVVRENGNQYRGSGEVTAYGARLPISAQILADKEHVITDIAPADWSALIRAIYVNELSPLDGKYASDVLSVAQTKALLPPSLLKTPAEFVERMDVVVPITHDGNYYFGTGCKAHQCGSDMAAWAIDAIDLSSYAVTLTTDDRGSVTFRVYGGPPQKQPAVIMHWATENGITASNSVFVDY